MHHLLAAILAILVLGVSKHHVTAFLNNRQLGGSQKSTTTLITDASSSQLIAETNVISTEDQDSNSNNNDQQYSPLLSAQDIQKISSGGVAIIPNWLPPNLLTKMREDAHYLFNNGQFQPDGLTNTARKRDEQGFTVKADRQTFRGGAGWDSPVGNTAIRAEFASRMKQLRLQLSTELDRPTLAVDGEYKHEMTYNWYEVGAKLGRHLDEHHEETKGTKGWMMPTRRSVTWLVYLNDGWQEEEGGALRCFPRSDDARTANNVQVGCHEGNLQVGWLNDSIPVFLDVFRESGGAALYQLASTTGSDRSSNERQILSVQDFNVPGQPIDFSIFLKDEVRDKFEQISTSRLDPRFATASTASAAGNAIPTHDFDCSDERTILDIPPTGGTLVVFDSVSLPHLVREVTGKRQRLAATGWFHEDSQFAIEM